MVAEDLGSGLRENPGASGNPVTPVFDHVVAPLSIPIGVKNAPSFTFRAALRKRTSEASPLI
jgi:hypothetical protein